MARTLPSFALTTVLTAVTVAACGSSTGTAGTGSSTESIKIGAVSSLTGPGTFTGATEAARAVFDAVNAAGGINGRTIDYLVEDDQNNPSTAAQAARRLVTSEHVLAMAGSASVLECQVNGALYEQQGLVSVPAVSADNGCFTSKVISGVNTGPFVTTTASLTYASQTLKAQRLCYLQNDIPGTQDAYSAAVQAWQSATGAAPLAYDYRQMKLDGDPTAQVLAVAEHKCDTVVLQTLEPQAISMITTADRQNISGVTWVLSSSNYTAGTATALKATTQHIVATAEFAPFTDAAAIPEDFSGTMSAAKVPVNSFAEGGYVAANVIVTALRSISGEVTRESLTAAIKKVNYSSTLLAQPYAFAPTVGANRSVRVVELSQGAWRPLGSEWITVKR